MISPLLFSTFVSWDKKVMTSVSSDYLTGETTSYSSSSLAFPSLPALWTSSPYLLISGPCCPSYRQLPFTLCLLFLLTTLLLFINFAPTVFMCLVPPPPLSALEHMSGGETWGNSHSCRVHCRSQQNTGFEDVDFLGSDESNMLYSSLSSGDLSYSDACFPEDIIHMWQVNSSFKIKKTHNELQNNKVNILYLQVCVSPWSSLPKRVCLFHVYLFLTLTTCYILSLLRCMHMFWRHWVCYSVFVCE